MITPVDPWTAAGTKHTHAAATTNSADTRSCDLFVKPPPAPQRPGYTRRHQAADHASGELPLVYLSLFVRGVDADDTDACVAGIRDDVTAFLPDSYRRSKESVRANTAVRVLAVEPELLSATVNVPAGHARTDGLIAQTD
jgi:hypothetical protein